MSTAYLMDAVRTPVGKLGGALAGGRPDDLAAVTLQELLARNPDVDPAEIDDVFLGNANGAGEENRNVARMSALLAGLPTSVPGTTVNRLCGSGLEAAIQAARAIETGDASLVIAGGVESMSRAPWVLPKPDRAYTHQSMTAASTTLGWRLVNPRMPAEWTIALSEGAELLADKYGISRAEQDEFALASHGKAARAWASGRFDAEVVPWTRLAEILPQRQEALARDETIRDGGTLATMAALKPAFRTGGTVTAGNASPLNDGASAVLLVDEKTAAKGTPLARIVSRAVHAVEPQYALGNSGTRLLTTLAHELRRRGGGYGLATLCIGVGQGLALVIEA